MKPDSTQNARILLLAPLAALLSFTLSTCTEPVSTQCPTGVVCPAGKKCAANQPVCIVDSCGDGVVQDGEVCDDGNLISGDGCSADCLSNESCGNGKVDTFLVTDSATGTQKPKEACDDGNTTDGDGCSADCQSNEMCGNGIVDRQVGEICDDANKDYGDGCSGDCLSNETCGNGYADVRLEGEKKEVCDDGNAEAGDGCTPDCKSKEECGNGYVDFNESCDDGDRESGDGCSADCRSDESCGNGYIDTFIDPGTGKPKEVCDDGNTTSGDGCSDTCKSKEECGNGILDPIRINPETGETETLEVCDDGNRISGDRCSADCKSTESCGNGYVDAVKGEICDDGNNESGDGCSADCRSSEFCGNGIVDTFVDPATGKPKEACDDGNNISGDGCSADCKSNEGCGNGIVDTFIVVGTGKPKEVCDDGNNVSGDACSADCQSNGICGNSYVDVTEQCDSGGYDTPLCDTDCTIAYCGDGHANASKGEACDDAGESATCDPDCSQATCGDRYWNATAGESCDTGGNSQFCDSDCTAPLCGDGLLNAAAGELCDDGNTVSGDGCSADCKSTESCGNGYVDSYLVLNSSTGEMEPAEVCDDRNTQSGDGCSSNCKSNETCGNGIVDTARGETCDDGNTNDGDECAGNCKSTGNCGNLIIDVGEQCDDGNSLSTDDCVACKNAYCGDGFTNLAGGEKCDTAGPSETCNANCTLSVCGDGIVNQAAGEQCDASGESANCDTDCTVAFCGDGKINAARNEQCDDSGPSADCNSNCTVSVCGDGILNPADNEACDPGASGETRYCDSDCTPSSCGDGLVNTSADEQCDDANQSDEDACRTNCKRNVCGDGLVNAEINPVTGLPFEACDDGNAVSETSCPYGEATCTPCNGTCTAVLNLTGAFCGNGVKEGSEVCDDGDTVTETECDYGTRTCMLCDSTCRTALSLTGRYCGDGSINGVDEVCDDGNTADETACPYGQASCSTCNATCTGTLSPTTVTYCGDGVKNGPENCDDGDTISETECDYGTRTCTLCDASCSTILSLTGRFCGDGSVNADGEICDDGNNTNETSCPYGQPGCTTCNSTCTATISPTTVSYCGDGTQNGTEICDDANTITESACEYGFPTCVRCDSSCSTVLNLTGRYCGDTLITDGENCDDGNAVTEAACPYGFTSCSPCNATCTATLSGLPVSYCGDTVKNGPEACDDGNTVSETACAYGTQNCLGCAADCLAVLTLQGPYCGDNVKNGAELCDDGNTVTETECPYGTATCTVCTEDCLSTAERTGHYCGDGLVTSDPGHVEVCDDRSESCGTCNATCAAVEFTPATGTIRINDKGGLGGNTFTLNDGTNSPVTFEFNTSGGVSTGNVEVWMKNYTNDQIAQAIVTAVNGQGANLLIGATRSANVVTLTNDQAGGFGNQQITKTVTASTFIVSGMAGGKGRDCAKGLGCASDNDCERGLACDLISHTCEVPSFAVIVEKDGNGGGLVVSGDGFIDCGSTCGHGYQYGDPITLTATADAHSVFTGWSGGGCTGTDPCEIVVAGNTTVVATFTAKVYGLTVAKAGVGVGAVTSDVGGIDCGSSCTADLNALTVVTLTATPNATSSFAGWSDPGCPGTGTCTVTMDAAKTVTATFDEVRYTLGVTMAGDGTGSVASSPAGITCGTDCAESYLVGTSVTLTATADSGSAFTGWSDAGCPGTGTCVVNVSAAKSVTATFVSLFDLTVTTSGTGTGTVATDPAGTSCGAGCQTYHSGTVVTLTPAAEAGSAFAGWTGACSGMGSCQVTMSAAKSVGATFELAYTLTVTTTAGGVVSSVPAGIDCGGALSDCSEEYVTGASVTLTALPDAGMVFTGWTGACTGAGTCTVAMTEARSVGASFAAALALTVVRDGTGTGTVASAPAGIDCGSTCTADFAEAGTVVLTATAASGSVFAGWSGAGCTGTGTCTVTMDVAKSVTATFDLLNRLTVTRSGSGTGAVSSAPAGIDCGSTCFFDFAPGASVTLTATATAPSVFAGWSGEGCSGTDTCQVTMSAARSVSALFSTCGDGTPEGLETCDDGNTAAGDGCSATCVFEDGFSCSGTPSACYPVITVNGLKEDVWSHAVVGFDASSVGLPNNDPPTPGERISNVRVTNDATDLYVLVEAFDDTWDDSRSAYLHLYFVIGGADGTITADGATNSNITFAEASVNPSYLGRFKFDSFAATDAVEGVVAAGKATSGYAELRIPLASLGAPAAGQTVGLIVGYRGDDAKPGFSDIAPYKASAISDWGDSASAVDPSAGEYFSYTVR